MEWGVRKEGLSEKICLFYSCCQNEHLDHFLYHSQHMLLCGDIAHCVYQDFFTILKLLKQDTNWSNHDTSDK